MKFEKRGAREQDPRKQPPNKRNSTTFDNTMRGYSPATLPAVVPRRAPSRIRLPLWMAVLVLLAGLIISSVLLFKVGQYLLTPPPNPVELEKRTIDLKTRSNALEAVRFPHAPTFEPTKSLLSNSWSQPISQWQATILSAAEPYQFAPDLIAAIVEIESDGIATGVSYAGAVGLMGVMPQGSGAGLENRPNATQLRNPALNLKWGTQILANYLHDADGDLLLALSAYNGGWGNANSPATITYALEVLHQTGYAMATHAGVADAAAVWGVDWEICPCSGAGVTIGTIEVAPTVLFDDGELRLEGIPESVVER